MHNFCICKMLITFFVFLIFFQLADGQNVFAGGNAVTQPPTQTLPYSISSYSKKLSQNDTKAAIRYAFDQWSAVIPIDFIEISSSPTQSQSADLQMLKLLQPVHIRIKFETGENDERFYNSTLIGYTFPNGEMFFNDDIPFKMHTVGEKVNPEIKEFKWIVMHTIGHLLGLDHSLQPGSVMQATDVSTTDADGRYIEPKLVASDVQNIQAIFGPRDKSEIQKIMQFLKIQ